MHRLCGKRGQILAMLLISMLVLSQVIGVFPVSALGSGINFTSLNVTNVLNQLSKLSPTEVQSAVPVIGREVDAFWGTPILTTQQQANLAAKGITQANLHIVIDTFTDYVSHNNSHSKAGYDGLLAAIDTSSLDLIYLNGVCDAVYNAFPASTRSALAAHGITDNDLVIGVLQLMQMNVYVGESLTSLKPDALTAFNIWAATPGMSITVQSLLNNGLTWPNIQSMLNVTSIDDKNLLKQIFWTIYLKAPTASPGTGSYAVTQSVALSQSQGAGIVYTTDGSDPRSSGTKSTYTGWITVSATTTIKAAARVIEGALSAFSPVASFTYTLPTTGPPTGGGVPLGNSATFFISPGIGGTATLGGTSITFPPGALKGTSITTVTIQQVGSPPSPPPGYTSLGAFDIIIGGAEHTTFNDPPGATLTMTFDPAKVPAGTTPVIYFYDDVTHTWLALTGKVTGNTITVHLSHTTTYAVMVTQAAPPPVPAITFSDVTASYWAFDVINDFASRGFISGYPDGTFRPDNKITRAEFISILDRALQLPAYKPAAPDFSDVSSDSWYYGSVESAVYAGIVKGYGNGDFAPNALISRQEITTILVNALSKADVARALMGAQTSFTDDADIAAWARGFVVEAGQLGLIKGYPAGVFAPQQNATRAEACVLISKSLDLLTKKS